MNNISIYVGYCIYDRKKFNFCFFKSVGHRAVEVYAFNNDAFFS